MMTAISLQQVAEKIPGSKLQGNCEFTSVSTDTRSVKAGDLFVALKGDNYDAHTFLDKAVEKQAAGLLVEKSNNDIILPQLVVDNSVKALGKIAEINREAFTGPLVAITGSGGKTTVKNMVGNILSRCGSVCITQGNFNNHIGVPLTLFNLGAKHDYAVVEMGASGPGEIAYLCDVAHPDVAVVTNAMHAHVEGFGSLEGIGKAKGEIFSGLKTSGTAVINIDDAQAPLWKRLAKNHKVFTFSVTDADADFSASELNELSNGSYQFKLTTPTDSMQVALSVLGRHNVANAVAAAACAFAAGASNQDIQQGLQATQAYKGRMQAKKGLHGSVVIDDSYNANLESVKAAIDFLAQRPGKTILVLGDMGEQGADEVEYHKELGIYAKQSGVQTLITKGELVSFAGQAFGENARHFSDFDSLNDYLRKTIDADTVVLVKGSRFTQMEHVVSALAIDEDG